MNPGRIGKCERCGYAVRWKGRPSHGRAYCPDCRERIQHTTPKVALPMRQIRPIGVMAAGLEKTRVRFAFER